ncbi:hypothetical protein SEA_ALBRIGHT_60 [Microbacterium phage Albright]|uniref:hypothetical protein n=1 Tax=Microbacterium phage Albright TaxID=2816467 RepID=UPI001BB52515|nr:hypothetical protein QDW28_gp60 [Microbacterium phage Albright]QTF82235.1 hypothetical protein SEA_ALBRIGHT_60 [Microbacterium phage Albright]
MTALDIEPMDRVAPAGAAGLMVKGTSNPALALTILKDGLVENAVVAESGWFRKVPAQWGGWNLYAAQPFSRGAFQAVTFYTNKE